MYVEEVLNLLTWRKSVTVLNVLIPPVDWRKMPTTDLFKNKTIRGKPSTFSHRRFLAATTLSSNRITTMPPQYPLPSSLEIIEDEISIPLQRTDSLSSAESSALPASPSNLSLSTAAKSKPAVDSKTTTTSRKNGQYTVEEVAKHNKKDDAWLIYNNQVVDVSKWVSYTHVAKVDRIIS